MLLRRSAVLLALVAAAVGVPVLSGSAAPATVQVSAGDLPALRAELDALTAQASALAGQLEQAASRDGGLRIAMEDLAEQEDDARAAFDLRVREVYMRSGPRQLDGLRELMRPGTRVLGRSAAGASLEVERELIEAVSEQSSVAVALKAESERFREGLRVQTTEVLAAQDRARELLATAESLAREEADRVALAAARAQLDAVSATVTLALTPAQTDRSRRAAADQTSVLATVEAAGAAYPRGYAPTGQVITGDASWYGPGFVGSPTASGAPYDPERLTCANKELPLGSVVRVSRGALAVSCLVNDRGPYVGDRVLDMSRAGSRALGYDGVATVTIELLAATG